jgi:phosphoglycerol transferase MdoB-like AlkP superfamily enzyme
MIKPFDHNQFINCQSAKIMKIRNLSGNIFIVLTYRILLIMVLLTVSRIGFYIYNHDMFPGISIGQFIIILKGGLVFDISAVVYFNMLFIFLQTIPLEVRYNKLFQNGLKYLFFITNGVAISANGADYVYFRFLNKRATSDIFHTFENEQRLPKMIFGYFIDYWPATLFGFLLLGLMVWLYSKVKTRKPEPANKLSYWIINIMMIPLVLTLVVGAARGGYRHSTRPITISNAARYVKNPRDVAIVLNTPFSLLRTFNKKELYRYNYFSEAEAKKLYNPHFVPADSAQFRPMNIVIIIMESFAREYIGTFNKDLEGGTYKGYTPFLDSLISVGLTFDVSLANGNKSIDAMPSILASMPSLETPYIVSHYANNTINGIGTLLKKKGYYSVFFHGAPNGSMGFDSFSRMAGFDEYFGMDQYPHKKDFDGIWGVWDEPFFQFFAGKLNTFKEPFLASIFSVSSHHPFKVPEKYTGKFMKGPIPICEVINYSDFALREFFNEVSGKQWFKNTLFVITADHTNEKFHKEYQNSLGQFSIPILFYQQGSDLKGYKKKIAQQIDIMPTILSYLHFDEEYIAFGNNLLDEKHESFGYNTYGSTYYLFMKDHILDMIENKPVGLYNYKSDRYFKSNLLNKEPEMQKQMEDKLKAIVQTYNSRLIDNNMIVRK